VKIVQEEKDGNTSVRHPFTSRFGAPTLLSAALFSIVPILFFIAVNQLTKAKGPQWLPYTFENPYDYLLNSLLLLKGQPSPFTIDPGTTTLTFGATVLRASSLKSTDNLVEYSLRNPEKQINTLHRALLIFTVLVIWLAPWITAVGLKNYIAGLLIQSPVLFFQSLLYWGIVFGSELMYVGFSIAVVCCCVLLLVSPLSQEEFVLGVADTLRTPGSARSGRILLVASFTGLVCALAILAWHRVFGPELLNVGISLVAICGCALLISFSKASKQMLIFGVARRSAMPTPARSLRIPVLAPITGLLCAFGIVTKLVFFPLILISLFCCRTLRNLMGFATAFVLGLAFALAPIYSKVAAIVTFAFNIGIHSGTYGQGSVGFPEIEQYLQSLGNLFHDEPLAVIIPAIATVVSIVLLAFDKDNRHVLRSTVFVVIGLQALSYCVIAKGIYTRYLFPLCLSAGLNLVLLLYVFQTSRSITKRLVGSLTLIGLLLLGFKGLVELTPKAYQQLRNERTEQVRLYQHTRDITKNDVRIDYFFSDSPEYPLFSANETAGRAFSSLLTKLYPNAPLFFNYNSGGLETFAGPVKTAAELQKHDHLYFLGDREWLPNLDGLDQGTLETIDEADGYSLDKWTRKTEH
jgi:hypothetical protein